MDTPSTNSPTESLPYVQGRWGGSNKALFLHGGNEYTFHDTSSELNDDKGSFTLWYRPDYSSGEAVVDRFLISGSEFCRLYFDASTSKFTYEMWDGDDWTSCQATSTVQAFPSGTWIHIGATYNNTSGVKLYLSGTLTGSDTTTWTAQSTPGHLAIGCVSGTLTNRADGAIDDFRAYTKQLTSSELNRLKNQSYGSN